MDIAYVDINIPFEILSLLHGVQVVNSSYMINMLKIEITVQVNG